MNNRIFSGACLVVMALLALAFVRCGSSDSVPSDDEDFVFASDQGGRAYALKALFTEAMYNTITEKSRNDPRCKESNRVELGLSELPNGQWYYTYENLIAGMAAMEGFGTASEDDNINRLEIAAFLANIAQETGAGYDIDPDYGGPGCFIQEGAGSVRDSCSYGGCVNTPGYDDSDTCKANGKKCPAGDIGWSGRGPHQLSWPSNYAAFGATRHEGDRYRSNPDLLVQHADVGIQGSIWFWGHEEQSASFPPEIPFKPSAHNVIVGRWTPTEFDIACGRIKPGLGVITNIINGGIECGPSATDEGRANAARRAHYFNGIAQVLGVEVPDGWADDCAEQKNFAQCPSYKDPTKRCGNGWSDANTKCGELCLSDDDCPAGEKCFGDLSLDPCQ